MRLREDRSYGTVYGHTKIAYEQDGRQFGPDKVMLEGPVPDDPLPPPATEAEAALKAERSARMKEAWARRKAAKTTVTS